MSKRCPPGRWTRAVTAAALALTALATAGCGGNRQSALDPHGRGAREISTLWWGMLVGAVVVLAVVLVLTAIAVLGRGAAPGPRLRAGTWLPVVGGIAVPVVALAVLFALVLGTLSTTSPGPASGSGGDAQLTVEVTARQWFWDVSYPAAGVRTANEIHVPVGVPVRVEVASGDVTHSFWVPELNRKVDAIPGRTNAVVLEATAAGVYRGQCSEFCGIQHANMAFEVVAEPRPVFDRWLIAQARPAAEPATAELKAGQQVLLGSACVYCHTIAGTNASGTIGPDLTHVAGHRLLAAGTVRNAPGQLAGWILDPQHVKPGNRMPGTDLTGPELRRLLDYLESLR